MRNLLIIILFLAIFGIGAYWYIDNVDSKYQVNDIDTQAPANEIEDDLMIDNELNNKAVEENKNLVNNVNNNSVSENPASQKVNASTREWNLIDQLSQYQKQGNLNGIRNLLATENTECDSDEECQNILNALGLMIEKIRSTNFVDVWKDSKQTIFTTDIKTEVNENSITVSKDLLFFFVDQNGDLKFVGLSTFAQSQNLLGTSKTESQIIDELTAKVVDSDMDGISDYAESCDPQESIICTGTDPEKRDTDSDGYWDGLEERI